MKLLKAKRSGNSNLPDGANIIITGANVEINGLKPGNIGGIGVGTVIETDDEELKEKRDSIDSDISSLETEKAGLEQYLNSAGKSQEEIELEEGLKENKTAKSRNTRKQKQIEEEIKRLGPTDAEFDEMSDRFGEEGWSLEDLSPERAAEQDRLKGELERGKYERSLLDLDTNSKKERLSELQTARTSEYPEEATEQARERLAKVNEELESKGNERKDIDNELEERTKNRKEPEDETISTGNLTINAGSINIKGDTKLEGITTIDQNGQANTPGETETQNRQVNTAGETGGNKDNDLKESTSGGRFKLEEGPLTRRDKKEIKENFGVGDANKRFIGSLLDGAHRLEDALYVTPAPGDWKADSQAREGLIREKAEKRKEIVEREKDNWAHNKVNISIMAEKYMDQYREDMKEMYPDKSQGYIEGKAREKSEEKAKAALKDMSVYVPYGITDVNLAYELYDNANKNSFTPEESIRSMVGYDKFNSNKANVTRINQLNIEGAGTYTTVEEAFENAKQYYANGYRSMNEFAAMDYVTEQLKTSPEFAMKIHEALKKKGGNITYSGKDPDVEAMIKELNKNYKKILKGMK